MNDFFNSIYTFIAIIDSRFIFKINKSMDLSVVYVAGSSRLPPLIYLRSIRTSARELNSGNLRFFKVKCVKWFDDLITKFILDMAKILCWYCNILCSISGLLLDEE